VSESPRVCIIGSGPGGAFAAVALAHSGFLVTVVEAGNDLQDSDSQFSITGMDILGGAKPNFGFSRQLGGSSNLWAGRVAPLEAIDFVARPWVPNSGWPFEISRLCTYYDEALTIMGLPRLDDWPARCDSLPIAWNSIQKHVDLKRFVWASPPFRTASYLAAQSVRRPAHLKVMADTRVLSLEVGPDGRRVVAANAVHQGTSIKLSADYFIIAAGGIETPRLLLNSNAYYSAGLGNAFGNVGRYLSTHPKADIGLLVLNRSTSVNFSAFADRTFGDVRVRTGIGLGAETQKELETLNHYVQLTPLFEHQANRAFEVLKGGVSVASPLINRSSAVRGFLPGLGSIAYEAVSRMAGLQQRARKFILRAFLDQTPSPDNCIRLSNDHDSDGNRKVSIEWTLSQNDKQKLLLFLGRLNSVFVEGGIGRIDYSVIQQQQDWPLIGIHSHFMGTTRMGNNPINSVVDRNCLVHGVDNCYVSGPSTFPTYGYANPFLTIAALSLRLAAHLRERAAH
jgi:choline dehydrogenase-like flavoprotein